MSTVGIDSRARYMVGALTVFVIALWFAILPQRPLFNPDEGRYAEIPREMLSGGDWVIPHLNGLAYIEKPPLQYWATALSLRVLGNTVFAARFYTALCALGTLSLVWFAAGQLWGTAAAWRSAAVLASMLLFVVMGQLLTLDMSLTLFTTASVCGFLRAQQRTEGKAWMLVAWVAAALGVLTKGLEAVVLPAGALVLYSVYQRDVSPWRRLAPLAGFAVFLLITLPWHWIAARRLPDFLHFFFIHEHFSRYFTPSADREEPWWFFGVVFVLGSIPWVVSAIRVVVSGWRRSRVRVFDPRLFLWIWVVFVGVFFSLSSSKLIPYLLPALPAVALLIGGSSATALRRDLRLTAAATLVAGIALTAVCVSAPHWLTPSDRNQYFLALVRPLFRIAALLSVTGLLVLLQRHRELTRDTVLLGAGWCVAGLLLMRAATAVAPVYSGIELARAVDGIPSAVPIYSVATYDQTLPFYWQRTVILVAYRGELDFGLQQQPAAEIARIEDFDTQWRNAPAAYAVMEMDMFDHLQNQNVPMRVIAHDVRRVLVSRE